MMLLADPRLAYLSGATLAPALVDAEIESGLEALGDILGKDTARLLLVEFADELPSTLPVTFQHSKQPAPSGPRAAPTPARPPAPASGPEARGATPATPPAVLPGSGPRREGAAERGRPSPDRLRPNRRQQPKQWRRMPTGHWPTARPRSRSARGEGPRPRRAAFRG